jgi:mevalonate kinase
MQEFYAHGKLLISGEYLVLKGAIALAVPTKFGQKMEIIDEPGSDNIIHWKSYDVNNNCWAEVLLSKDDLLPFRGSVKNIDEKTLITLQKILNTIRQKQPTFLRSAGTTQINNYLEFDRNWGLGSSSTLLNNIAQYAKVDAFELNKSIFKGSGFDIACAQSSMPIFYKIDEEGIVFDSVHFNPPQHEQFVFVHLGNKQDSKTEVETFLQSGDIVKKFANEIEIISEISEALLFCDDFNDFMQLLDEHEEVMQYVLQEEKVKTKMFSDFNGVVKSLGAWGGDFVLAASAMDSAAITAYFKSKGLNTIIPYEQMVL